MNINKKLYIFISIVFLFLLTIACGFSVSTANIKDAYMARASDNGLEKVDTFTQDETLLCYVALANAPDDTTVSATWYAVDVEGVDPNFLIDETSITTGENDVFFDLTNDNYWPAGSYRVDIFLNEEFSQSVEFTVQ